MSLKRKSSLALIIQQLERFTETKDSQTITGVASGSTPSVGGSLGLLTLGVLLICIKRKERTTVNYTKRLNMELIT